MPIHANSKIFEMSVEYFKDMLNAGKFPEVNWSVTKTADHRFESYNMIEHDILFAKLRYILDQRIKTELQDPQGIFTRKRNACFLYDVKFYLTRITEDEVRNQTKRFRTMWD